MKKIIKNKVYDTATARLIGSCSRSEGAADSQRPEALYRKKTGEYFLHGEGGPMPKNAGNISSNGGTGNDRIMPLSLEAAREWAEEHLAAADYEAEFGPVAKDGTRTMISISLDAATAERIKRAAREKGVTVSALIASLFPA